MGLMFTSRYLAKSERERPNHSMEMFMAGGYIMCVGKITIAICTYPRILYVNSSLMNMGSTSEDGRRRTTSRYITPRYTNERFEAVYSVADCVSIDDVSFKVGGAVFVESHL
jgi:hypothetical protein